MAAVKDSVALSIYRAGGHISDLHATNLVKLSRRYRRYAEEHDEERMFNMRIAILATLADAGLSGWEVSFNGEDVMLTPPDSDASMYL